MKGHSDKAVKAKVAHDGKGKKHHSKEKAHKGMEHESHKHHKGK